jgi:hypothetical protein
VAAKVTEDFKAKHGENAVPVASLAESKDIEHLGKKGVVVSKQLGHVLAETLGNALSIKAALMREVVKHYGWHELAQSERDSLIEAVNLVNPIESVKLDDIEVVDFRDPNLMGQFKERRIFIAYKYLKDPNETLRILVHEVAHRLGDDGDVGHVHCIENIWKGIVTQLRPHTTT